jgi:hypothetical protein
MCTARRLWTSWPAAVTMCNLREFKKWRFAVISFRN